MLAFRSLIRPQCVILLILVVALGCGAKPASEIAAGADQTVIVAKKESSPPPQLSQAQKQQFVDRLNAAIAAGDLAGANRCIDWNALIDRSLDGLIGTSKNERDFEKGFHEGATRSLNKKDSLIGQIIAGAASEGGVYKLIRFHQIEGHPYALFRLSGNDGLNYHDYRLTERGGEVSASDIYIFLSGEHLSETVRRMAIPALQQLNKSWLAKIGSSDKAFFENFEQFTSFGKLVMQGQAEEAMEAYHRMPPELQRMKIALIQRYHAASMISDQAVLEATDAYEEAFPNDPSLPLVAVDGLIIRGEYDKALAAIDTLDKAVGGDPFLNQLRASIELERGDLASASRYALEYVKDAPSLIDRHWLLVGVLLQSNQHAATYDALAEMESRFQLDMGDLRDLPEYAGFVASAEGQRWLREHGVID